MVKKIKYNRLFSSLDRVISASDFNGKELRFKTENTNYILFFMKDDGEIIYFYNSFIHFGMSEDITHSELETYLYERFNK